MSDYAIIVGQIRELSEAIAATVAVYPWSATMVEVEDSVLTPPYRQIVQAVRSIGVAKADPLALIHALQSKHAESQPGEWKSIVLGLDSIATHPSNLAHHQERLARLTACMRAAPRLRAALEAVEDGNVEQAEQAARESSQTLAGWVGASAETTAADEAMTAFVERLDNSTPLEFISSGLRALDEMVGPVLAPGRLIVAAARPGMGKTAFALNIAAHVAKASPVLYWCGEMSEHELFGRILCAESRVPLTMINTLELKDIDRDRVRVAAARVSNLHLNVSTGAGMTVGKIDAMVRAATVAKRKPALVVVDYMQRMGAKGSRSREEEVGSIARGLKELAKEHNVCVLALAQMNREVEKRVSGRPKLSDLRESGQIEQEADAIIFPDRESEPVDDLGARYERTWPMDARLFIEKFRHGKAGEVLPMLWHGPFQTWRDK